jgi:hypothetical protein
MYFRFNLLVYQFAKIFVEKTNSQTYEKSQWCHIFKNGGSICLLVKALEGSRSRSRSRAGGMASYSRRPRERAYAKVGRSHFGPIVAWNQ